MREQKREGLNLRREWEQFTENNIEQEFSRLKRWGSFLNRRNSGNTQVSSVGVRLVIRCYGAVGVTSDACKGVFHPGF